MRTILVIDDEECIRGLIADVLEDADCRVVEAADGASGLDAARCHRPDIILLDWRMPGASGGEVLAQLRADPATAAAPVILMSGIVPNEVATGAAAWLTKPFSPTELREVIEAVLATAPQARAAAA